MPQIDIKLVSWAEVAGIQKTATEIKKLEHGVQSAAHHLDAIRGKINAAFAPANFAKSLLGGLGIGGGFALITTVADKVVEAWKDSERYAEKLESRAKSIAEQMRQTQRAVQAAFFRSQSPEQQKATLESDARKMAAMVASQEDARLKAQSGISWIQGEAERIGATLNNISRVSKATAANFGLDIDTDSIGARTFYEKLGEMADEAQKKAFEFREQLANLQADIKTVDETIADSASKEQKEADQKATEELKAQNSELAATVKRYLDTVLKPTLDAEHKLLEARQRSAAEKKRLGFAEQERRFAEQIAQLETERAIVQNNALLTEQQKTEQILPLIQRQNQLIAERIALLTAERALSGDPSYQLQLQEQIDRLQRELAQNRGEIVGRQNPETLMVRHGKSVLDLSDPSQHYQSPSDGAIGSLMDQSVQIGTMGDQVANAFTQAGQSIRTSLGSAFADAILMGGSMVDRLRNFAGAVGTAFVQAGAQMLADWIMKHTFMAAASAIFRTKEVAQTAMMETTKTGIVTTGELTRTGVVGAAAATNTGIITTAAGTQAGATGIAGVFRSIMELGPIAGPAVFAASVAGMIALVAGLAQGFETGGFPQGRNALIKVNENGQESVLNARATAMLGRAGVDALNNGEMLIPDAASAITRPGYQPNIGGAGGGDGANGHRGRGLNLVVTDAKSERRITEQLDRDPGSDTWFLNKLHKHRRHIPGVKV